MKNPLFIGACALMAAVTLPGCKSINHGDDQFQLRMATHGKDVMWVPSKAEIVHEMLAMAKVSKNDIVIDLGSGDGIIPIEAAKKYGVKAHGIEYNPDLVALSIRNAKRAGVEHLTSFKRGDIFVDDFSRATVLTLYLGENLNMKLKPRLLRLTPGTRVVSNTFRLGSWVPDQTVTTTAGETAYLWVVPASIDGDWDITWSDGAVGRIRVTQKKQFFDGVITLPGKKPLEFENARLAGREISVRVPEHSGKTRSFQGRVADDGQSLRLTDAAGGAVTAVRRK